MKLAWLLLTLAVFVYAQDDEMDLECSLKGDPELINFGGQDAPLPFPCLVHMASIHVKISKKTQKLYGLKYLTVDVFAQSNLTPIQGRYYTDDVTIDVKGHDMDTLELSVRGTYKVDSGRVREVWQRELESSEVWNAATTIDSSIIRADYDEDLNRARLRLLKESTRIMEISFRPFNESDNIPQKQRPGLYLTISSNRIKSHKARGFPNSLCSIPDDLRTFEEILDSKTYRGILKNKRQLLLFTALQQNEAQPYPVCQDFLGAFQTCGGLKPQLTATRDCSLYTTTAMVHCFQQKLNVVPVKILEQCYLYKCQKDPGAQAWLNGVIQRCPLPAGMWDPLTVNTTPYSRQRLASLFQT